MIFKEREKKNWLFCTDRQYHPGPDDPAIENQCGTQAKIIRDS